MPRMPRQSGRPVDEVAWCREVQTNPDVRRTNRPDQ